MSKVQSNIQGQRGWRMALGGLILSISLAACANRDGDSAPSAEPEPSSPAATGDWFCQPAPAGAAEPWECVQDKNLAANPKPDRLPNAKEETLPVQPSAPLPPPPPTPTEDSHQNQAPVQSADPPEPNLSSNGQTTPVSSSLSTSDPTNRPQSPATKAKHQPTRRQATPDYIRLAYQPKSPVSILELPGSYYAVQLAALSSAQKLQSFLDKHELNSLTAAKVAIRGKVRYVLILGIYDSREKAEIAAADRLPAPLASFTPWIRRLSNLQEAMRLAEVKTKA